MASDGGGGEECKNDGAQKDGKKIFRHGWLLKAGGMVALDKEATKRSKEIMR